MKTLQPYQNVEYETVSSLTSETFNKCPKTLMISQIRAKTPVTTLSLSRSALVGALVFDRISDKITSKSRGSFKFLSCSNWAGKAVNINERVNSPVKSSC